MAAVDLGFIEPSERPEFLLNIHFPSKVGGRPAWLNLENVPAPEDLKCAGCADQLTFLLQLYASLEKDDAFHRTIYVFVCSNEGCGKANRNDNFKVFRNQIPRRNSFYDYHPVPEDAQVPEARHKFKLCCVCGCRGPFNCAKCKNVSYCSKGHQKIDWRAGHKESCGHNDNASGSALVQLPELEIILEQEQRIQDVDNDTEDPHRLEKEMEELKKFETNDGAALQNLPESELSKYTAETEEDKFFSKFRKRISDEPEQILRYDREGKPLWMAEANRLDTVDDVPKCENCQGERVFEFQVMPQLLNSLKSDSLDWGILAVYTCKASCGSEGKYLPEFIHKQDIVSLPEGPDPE